MSGDVRGDPAYQKLVAYGILLLFATLISRTRLGYQAIYYILWLVILGLVVQNAAQVIRLLQPIVPE